MIRIDVNSWKELNAKILTHFYLSAIRFSGLFFRQISYLKGLGKEGEHKEKAHKIKWSFIRMTFQAEVEAEPDIIPWPCRWGSFAVIQAWVSEELKFTIERSSSPVWSSDQQHQPNSQAVPQTYRIRNSGDKAQCLLFYKTSSDVRTPGLKQRSPSFSVKGQRVKVLDFVVHTVLSQLLNCAM